MVLIAQTTISTVNSGGQSTARPRSTARRNGRAAAGPAVRCLLDLVCHALYCSHFARGSKWPCGRPGGERGAGAAAVASRWVSASARATTATATMAAPACFSTLAASLHVAPVVKTSSTSRMRASLTAAGRRTRNAPRTFSNAAPRSQAGLRQRVATPHQDRPHRRRQPSRQATRQQLGTVLATAEAAAPEHRDRHDQVRPNRGQSLLPHFEQKPRRPPARGRRGRDASSGEPRRGAPNDSRPAESPSRSESGRAGTIRSPPVRDGRRESLRRNGCSPARPPAQTCHAIVAQTPIPLGIGQVIAAIDAARREEQVAARAAQTAEAGSKAAEPNRYAGAATSAGGVGAVLPLLN